MNKLKGLYAISPDYFELVYTPLERRDIERMVEIYAPQQSRVSLIENPKLLEPCEVIFSGWGGPVFNENLLAEAPNLKLILYAAGSAKGQVSQAMWDRGVRLSSAYNANAVPVMEYSLAAILFSLKHCWRYISSTRESRCLPPRESAPGAYGATVGLVSLGMVARLLCERLQTFDLKVIAYDPFVSKAEAEKMGVRLVGLEELFAISDVVSLHSPELPETEGLITGELIALLKDGAALINTARGSLIRQNELVEVVAKRPDLQVILDVTDPEPTPPGSPLFDLPNVFLTPHVAGSMNGECRRMGRAMVAELERFTLGQPLKWEITPELARISSHRPRFMEPPTVANFSAPQAVS